MSYYNQPLLDDWAKLADTKLAAKLKNGSQIEKWRNIKWVNIKMAQAIFLPGAWGKIPVFMGKNHPTPPGCYGFSHALNYPPKTGLFQA